MQQLGKDILRTFPFMTGFFCGELGWFVGEWIQPQRRPPFTTDAGLLGGALSFVPEKLLEMFNETDMSLFVYLLSFLGGMWLNLSTTSFRTSEM